MDKYFFSKTQNYFSIPSIKLPVVKKELPLERTRSTDLEATEGSQSLSWFKRPLISTKCMNWDKIRLQLDLWTAELQHQFSSVQFSHSVMSDSLWPHEPQHARPSCPSPTPGIHPNPCSSSQWCHPAISSSAIPFSSCPQSFPASGSFQMSQFFAAGGQSIRVSASTSVPLMNTQDWFPLGWTGWISLQSKGLSRVFSNTTVQKHQLFGAQLSL